MNRLKDSATKDSCIAPLKKLACASYSPPCDGNKMQTLCKSSCEQLYNLCPGVYNFSEVSSYCAEPAQGRSDSGFCELTRWPTARYWDEPPGTVAAKLHTSKHHVGYFPFRNCPVCNFRMVITFGGGKVYPPHPSRVSQVRTGLGARFSKVPKSFRARKAITKTLNII